MELNPFRSALLRFANQPPHAIILLSSRFGQPPEGLKPNDVAEAIGNTADDYPRCFLTPSEIDSIAEILCKFPFKLAQPATELAKHPDLCIVDRVRKVLRLEELEPLRARALFPPQAAKKRLFVIEMAHRLTTHAANSLLKALEEPMAESLYVLTAPSVSHVLPTLTSRCVRIQMGPLAQETSLERQAIEDLDTEDQLYLKTLVAKIAQIDPLPLCSTKPLRGPEAAQVSAPSAVKSKTTNVNQLLDLSADLEFCDGLAKRYQASQLIDTLIELATKQSMSFGICWLVEKLRHWQNTRDYNPSAIMRLTELVVAARHSPNAPQHEKL